MHSFSLCMSTLYHNFLTTSLAVCNELSNSEAIINSWPICYNQHCTMSNLCLISFTLHRKDSKITICMSFIFIFYGFMFTQAPTVGRETGHTLQCRAYHNTVQVVHNAASNFSRLIISHQLKKHAWTEWKFQVIVYVILEEPTRCSNNLLIYKISSTCFKQSFAHLQERKTEIFTAYGILLW